MNKLTALRLYLPQSARAKPTRFWHRISAPLLSHRLLHAAQRMGIHQAVMHSVHAGYLPGKKLSFHHAETPSAHHPLCIELIDSEPRLHQFLQEHGEDLQGVQTVLFRCDLVKG